MKTIEFHPDDYPIVLFDSQCLICDGFVRWIMRRDPKRKLKFTGLGSDKAQHSIERHEIHVPENGTVILLFEDRYFMESAAVIEILKITDQPAPLINLISFIPQTWRDGIYRWVARNRYRFYKKREYCPVPGPEEAGRFV